MPRLLLLCLTALLLCAAPAQAARDQLVLFEALEVRERLGVARCA
jgi:hypothetical protein